MAKDQGQEPMTEERMEDWLRRLLEDVRKPQAEIAQGQQVDDMDFGLAFRGHDMDMEPPNVATVRSLRDVGRGPGELGLLVIMADGSHFEVMISKVEMHKGGRPDVETVSDGQG